MDAAKRVMLPAAEVEFFHWACDRGRVATSVLSQGSGVLVLCSDPYSRGSFAVHMVSEWILVHYNYGFVLKP
jgi:hypothetical protein